ncbi:SpoIIE family protein phosphatase [Nocardioides alcanivorans]|uniref:SpoIIE family protein phosphatase n=1 Tax=Nocardioides alcanivorans TaxID=2897352 RepID=UPI001F211863|nr:SpoIIE family protein phosphatase [Nocardioides alcanivorans]
MITTPTDLQIPHRLPVVPGVVLHGSYLLTDREPCERGDTLEAFVLPDQKLALVVADVVGHGLAASMAVAQVRAVLRERLVAGVGLVAAATAVDTFLRHVPELGGVTACVVLLDPTTGVAEYVAAGHPGPVAVAPDASVWRPEPHPCPPLGLGASGQLPHVGTHQLAGHDLLLLHTDGVSSGDAHFDVAVAQALEAAAHEADPAARIDALCSELLVSLVPDVGLTDDAVLLGALRIPQPVSMAALLPASRASIGSVRSELDHWLDEVGAGLLDHASLVQAVDEITTNVVDHAYPVRDGMLRAGARLERSGRAIVTVTDRGTWPAGEPHGHGMTMAAALTDSFRVERGVDSNTVEMCHELSRSVNLLEAVPVAPARDAEWETELEVDSGPGWVSASGPVDDLSCELFRTALTKASEGGQPRVVVDLTAVSRLASPGVQALHELCDAGTEASRDVVVIAIEDSLVARVLTVTAVPHRTIDPF